MSFEGNLAYIPTEEEIETAWWLFFGTIIYDSQY